MRGPVLAGFLCVCLGLAVSTASAQEDDPGRTALARSLFREGVELGHQGHYAQAAERYRRVLELRPTPQVRYNLAHALAETGRAVEPAELARQILRDPSAGDDVREEAQALLDRVAPRVGRLTLRVEGPRSGVTVLLDGEPVPDAALGVAVPADPGRHRVVAERHGEAIASRTVTIAPGGTGQLSLELPSPAAEIGVPRPAPHARDMPGEDDDEERPRRGWIAAVVVLLLAAGGGAAAAVLLTRDGDSLDGNLMPGRIVLQ